MRLISKLRYSFTVLIVSLSLGACSGDSDTKSQQASAKVDQSKKKEILSLLLESSYECGGSNSRFWSIFVPSDVNQYEVKNLDFEITEIPTVTEADKLNGLEMKLIVQLSPEIAWRQRALGLSGGDLTQVREWTQWYSDVVYFDTAYPHIFEKRNGVWTYVGMRAAYNNPTWAVFRAMSKDAVANLKYCTGTGTVS